MKAALQAALESKRAADDAVRLLRLREVLERTGLSRSGLYAAIQAGSFPAPIQILPGGRATAWPESQINEWLRDRIATSQRARTGGAA